MTEYLCAILCKTTVYSCVPEAFVLTGAMSFEDNSIENL